MAAMTTYTTPDAFQPLTPHSHDQLVMTDRGDEEYILLMDKDTGRYRPAVVLHREECYAEIHTAEDYSRKQQCETKRQWEALEPHVMKWSPSDDVKRLVWKAQNGLLDEQAEAAGFDSAISYVLGEVEEREDFQHHENKNPHVIQ